MMKQLPDEGSNQKHPIYSKRINKNFFQKKFDRFIQDAYKRITPTDIDSKQHIDIAKK